MRAGNYAAMPVLPRLWIAAENFITDGMLLKLLQRGLQRGIVAVRLQVGEEAIFPRLLARRARLNHREVDAVTPEHTQYFHQRARLVRHQKGERSLIAP